MGPAIGSAAPQPWRSCPVGTAGRSRRPTGLTGVSNNAVAEAASRWGSPCRRLSGEPAAWAGFGSTDPNSNQVPTSASSTPVTAPTDSSCSSALSSPASRQRAGNGYQGRVRPHHVGAMGGGGAGDNLRQNPAVQRPLLNPGQVTMQAVDCSDRGPGDADWAPWALAPLVEVMPSCSGGKATRVTSLPRRDGACQRPAAAVGREMDFCRQPAARASEGMVGQLAGHSPL